MHVVDVLKIALGVVVFIEHVDHRGGRMASLSYYCTCRPGQIFTHDNILD